MGIDENILTYHCHVIVHLIFQKFHIFKFFGLALCMSEKQMAPRKHRDFRPLLNRGDGASQSKWKWKSSFAPFTLLKMPLYAWKAWVWPSSSSSSPSTNSPSN